MAYLCRYGCFIWFLKVYFSFSFQAISEFKKGKVEYRADKTGIVHLPFGKVSFSDDDLIDNFLAAVVSKPYYLFCRYSYIINSYSYYEFFFFFFLQKSIEANKPSGAKGVYWKSAHVCSSMGPSIRLNIREMLDYKKA